MVMEEKEPENDAKKLINPPGTEGIYEKMKFSQAVRIGKWILVSGQVGMDEKLQTGAGIEAQARIAFRNLERVLSHAGATLDDIVELMTFHTSMADMAVFSKVKSEFISRDYPAWTAIGVKELVLPGLLVEIRATAVVENGN
ncbi:MAG: RidA family protein [Spirochaetes bacterium]|jgi:enamine deaminase RidA (YjgF/YER057c/UK114 family)|nr:RidA family protein [Spirochaetota bacterium]